MSEENKYTIDDLIVSSLQQKPLEFSSAFNSLMVDRLQSAIDNKKNEIAQTMYAPVAVEEPSFESEESSEEDLDG